MDWGRFEGDFDAWFLDDGRLCELLADYAYIQSNETRWLAPKGTKVDGASIPKVFWSLIGGPFEGKYRNASVIHDRYCDTHERPWRDTHRMFYEAMRCNGVAIAQAKIMYYAVYRFGPRWPEPGAPVPEALEQAMPRPLTTASAQSLLADAQAIYAHDLSIDSIEYLADSRNAQTAVLEGAIEPEAASPGNAARALALVVCGGSGTAEDLAAVAGQAALLPDYVIARFERTRTRIVACRESVTDFETDMRGQVPRGWERTGRTWDSVPGTYLQNRGRVVIATIEEKGARVVPTKASGRHGSDNLVVHESLHGFDYLGGHAVLREKRFTDARSADLPMLGGALGGYLVQPGEAGLEETFAESGARDVTDEAAMEADWPHLTTYWQQGPADIEAVGPPLALEAAEAGRIGTATIRADGSIQLDLRAEGPGGAIGHAMLEIPTDDAANAPLKRHLLKGPVPEAVGGEVRVPFLVE